MILKMNSYTETFGLSILVGYVAIFTIYVIDIIDIDIDRHAMTNKVVFHYFFTNTSRLPHGVYKQV